MTRRRNASSLAALALATLAAAGAQTPAGLTQVQAVYLLPMGHGLDQYLAGQLTRLGVFLVVTDPGKADAVFTERLGKEFEARLKELYPEPAPTKEGEQGEAEGPRDERAARVTSLGRARGTIFLVDRRANHLLWSAYERPKNTTPDELNKTAERIARQLKKSLGQKP